MFIFSPMNQFRPVYRQAFSITHVFLSLFSKTFEVFIPSNSQNFKDQGNPEQQIHTTLQNDEVQNYDWTDLCWVPAGPCQLYWSVGGVWPLSGTTRLCPPAEGGQRSREAPPCSMSGTAVPQRRPLTTTMSVLATGGSSGSQWMSQQLKLAQHRKRSHCPEKEGSKEKERERHDNERDNKTWICISRTG